MGKILIVGDSMLDSSILGASTRLAQEAPIPVIIPTGLQHSPGGAANAAVAAALLGGQVVLLGACGSDEIGARLRAGLAAVPGLTAHLLGGDAHTTVKTRIYAGERLCARYDRDVQTRQHAGCFELYQELLAAGDVSLVVLCDYGKGVIGPKPTKWLKLAADAGIRTIVDPYTPSCAGYYGATIIKPNRVQLDEMLALLGSGHYDGSTQVKASWLRSLLNATHVLVTLGADGLFLYPADKAQPAYHPPVVRSLQGAGDAALAALAVWLAEDRPLDEALQFIAVVAGCTAGKLGTMSPTRAEVESILHPEKAKLLPTAATVRLWREEQRRAGRRVVVTNGCFDWLHPGHVHLLQQAALLGDILLVGVNSDQSVQTLKGASRPLINEEHRAASVASLSCVAAVHIFSDVSAEDFIALAEPDVLVKGEEYRDQLVVGAEFTRSRGGAVCFVPQLAGYSTTGLVNKLYGD